MDGWMGGCFRKGRSLHTQGSSGCLCRSGPHRHKAASQPWGGAAKLALYRLCVIGPLLHVLLKETTARRRAERWESSQSHASTLQSY